MTDYKTERKLCEQDGIFLVNGLSKVHGEKVTKVDKCKLTGCQCCARKCPKFHSRIKHTNSLANAGLTEQYEQEILQQGECL